MKHRLGFVSNSSSSSFIVSEHHLTSSQWGQVSAIAEANGWRMYSVAMSNHVLFTAPNVMYQLKEHLASLGIPYSEMEEL